MKRYHVAGRKPALLFVKAVQIPSEFLMGLPVRLFFEEKVVEGST